MSPEKMIVDPVAAPFLMGMVVKIKDFVAVKALTASIVLAFSIGIFYNQTNAMISKVDKFTARLETIEKAMMTLQTSQTLTNNNINHIVSDIQDLTAQVSEMMSYKAKVRR